MLLPTVGEGEKNHSKSLSQNWERDLERGQKGDMLPDGVRWKNSGKGGAIALFINGFSKG